MHLIQIETEFFNLDQAVSVSFHGDRVMIFFASGYEKEVRPLDPDSLWEHLAENTKWVDMTKEQNEMRRLGPPGV